MPNNTDHKIVARDLLSALFMDRGIHAQEDNLKILEQALLSERTSSYKAGMMRGAEIAHKFRQGSLSVQNLQALLETEPTTKVEILADGTIKGHDPAIAIAQAIRSEANKEIK